MFKAFGKGFKAGVCVGAFVVGFEFVYGVACGFANGILKKIKDAKAEENTMSEEEEVKDETEEPSYAD